MDAIDYRALCAIAIELWDADCDMESIISQMRAALAQSEPEGDRLFHWRNLGDGKPVQVQECPMCGIAPANVDDCGRFGDPACPYFGVGKPEPEGPTDKEIIGCMYKGAASLSGLEPTWIARNTAECVAGVRVALARWGRPAIEPEGPTDLDAEFRSWYNDRYCRAYFGGIALVECIEWTQFALARWGRSAIEPVDGEIDEEAATVIPWLLEMACQAVDRDRPYAAGKLTLAAQLLGERRPALKPVPVSDVRYEFIVSDAETDEPQASGEASTLEEAQREGMHYLAMHEEDGPMRLELRRVEVLAHHALPVPDVRKPDAGPPPLRCPGAHTIAECGGPCEQNFRLCDCGLLQQLNPQRAPNYSARGSESPLSEFSDGGMPLG